MKKQSQKSQIPKLETYRKELVSNMTAVLKTQKADKLQLTLPLKTKPLPLPLLGRI